MFSALPASHAPRARSFRETAVSVMFHGALLGGAVWVTSAGRGPLPPNMTALTLHYMAPASRPQPLTVHAPADPGVVALAVIEVSLPIPASLPPIEMAPVAAATPSTVNGPLSTPLARTVVPADEESDPYDVARVDKPVELMAGQTTPHYPELLRSAGVEGRVLARFVVDTSGRVERNSIDVTDASQQQFANAVRDVLLRQRFLPAESGSRRVRQLVVQPFEFRITRSP